MKQENQKQDFFSKLENTRPFLKMAFEGFPKSGKTFTSVQIAIGLHKMIKSTKPIVVYDTERALKALKPIFDKNKIEVLVRESRSLADLAQAIELCEQGTGDILIIDSITHVWEKFVESFKTEKKRTYISLPDWGILKPKWKREFSEKLVMSPVHIIFTGRAAFEYEDVTNESTGKRESIKSGIKMRAEGETAYEPDMLVYMEKVEELLEKDKKIWRQGTVMDRTDQIDGKTFVNPTFENFEPAIRVLLNGTAKKIEITETTDTFPLQDDKSTQRKIALEKVESIMVSLFPGQSTVDKKLKADIIEKAFETRSWKEVEIMKIENITNGLIYLQEFHKRYDTADKIQFMDMNKKGEPTELNPQKILNLFDTVIKETSLNQNPLSA
jgi:hypothetical protein